MKKVDRKLQIQRETLLHLHIAQASELKEALGGRPPLTYNTCD